MQPLRLQWVIGLVAVTTLAPTAAAAAMAMKAAMPEQASAPEAPRFQGPDWDGTRIVRLQPSGFPGLPASLVRRLENLGCTVPQTYEPSKVPQNVILGSFRRPGQHDWAVLCSRRGVSAILVFWNGSPDSWSELAPHPDTNFLQVTGRDAAGHDTVGYSRLLGVAGRHTILDCNAANGAPLPIPLSALDHQGIDDAYAGKASEIHYLHRGRWLELPGSD